MMPVESRFAKAVASGALVGEPEFLILSCLHMARALEMMDEAEDAGRLVNLFTNGAGPR